MTDASARFLLPFIMPGQAQKEVFHNEALVLLDAGLHPAIEDGPIAEAPAAPQLGESWIVGAGADGAWAGRDHMLATWTAGGWRFLAPVAGMSVWKKPAGYRLHWDGGAWIAGEVVAERLVVQGLQVVGPRLPEVPSPSGGTIIDAEARAAIMAIIATFKSHGLTE